MSRATMLAAGISAGLAVAGLAIAGVSGPAGAAVHPPTSHPAAAVSTDAASVPAFTRDTEAIGPMAASQRLTIQVWLQPNTAAATLFAQAVSTPGSPQFHHYVSPDAYAARFGATSAGAAEVESWLRAAGFADVAAGPLRSYVSATAPVSTINRAFAVELTLYKSSATVNGGDQALWSNDRPISLPASLAGVVLGVTGLDSAAPVSPSTATATETATPSAPCSQYYGQHLESGLPSHFGRTSFPTQLCGYSAKQLRAAYGATMTNTGKGQTIAFVELGPTEPDMLLTLQDYAKASGLPVPSGSQLAQVSAGKGCTDAADGGQRPAVGTGPDVEEPMDLEAAYAMAPGVKEVVVSGLACGGTDPETQGLLNALGAALGGSGHHPLASIVSNSWQSGPEGQPASVTKIEHADLVQAAAEGVGVYFAAGDAPGVATPADDPYAIAVGGTTLGLGPAGQRLFETGWSTGWDLLQNRSWAYQGEYDASGGGPSAVYQQPAYQKGVVPAALARPVGKHSGWYRSVPDLSASADPATAMAVGVLTITAGKKPVFSLTPGGGTSEATPLVAGMVAAAQEGAKTPFGFLDPVLYQLAGTSAFHDILPLTASTPALDRGIACDVALCGVQELRLFDVQSDDTADGFDGQVTQKGYDTMTGLGTPDGQAFIAALRASEK